MLFTPRLKHKKIVSNKRPIIPFPTTPSSNRFEGIFTGISVEVCDPADIQAIYENGCYGKGSESRSVPKLLSQFNSNSSSLRPNDISSETLTLDLEEACFLAYFLEILQIKDLHGNELSCQQLVKAAEHLDANYLDSLAAYLYLKSKGWVVKSGMKFGGNFLIYKEGPRHYHASFVVVICSPDHTEIFAAKDIKGLQRIAETSDKDVLLLEVSKPNDITLNHPSDIAAFSISETIVRRFNCTAFVQNQNSTT